jgi:hypothetical protein
LETNSLRLTAPFEDSKKVNKFILNFASHLATLDNWIYTAHRNGTLKISDNPEVHARFRLQFMYQSNNGEASMHCMGIIK